MNTSPTLRTTPRSMLKSLIIAAFAAQFTATSAHAALLDLATAPLADSTPTTVLPNLLFTMDDSGSMLQTYTPDYMSRWENFSSGHWGASNRTPGDNLEKNCKDSADDSGTDLDLCVPGDVPYMSPDLNSQYYNPAIQYIPGIKADGSSYESQTKANTANWTAVKSDGYGVTKRRLESTTSVATVNITSEIPDRLWCTTRSPTSNQRTNTATCRKNSDYLYPNATYKYGRNNSGAIVKDTGLGLYGNPYYYTVNVSEYCKKPDLKECTTATTATGEYVYPAKARWCTSSAMTDCQATKTSTYHYPRYIGSGYTFTRTDIIPAIDSYPKSTERTDCAGTTCTYEEEMTNYANWYAYYRTRNQAMKSSASRAFQSIGANFRVGYMTIKNTNFLKLDKFDDTASHRTNWFNKLFAEQANGGTPLRTAISYAGRVFAGKSATDPVQYSCQQNFLLLTTDGYWNGNGGYTISSSAMTDQDGGSTEPPKYQGYSSETLANNIGVADAAKYYYDTDLRQTSLSNCSGAISGVNVCDNGKDGKYPQRMVTFSLGLGVDGELKYSSDYDTASSGDFYDLKNGTKNWPKPVAESPAAVDDLWHAAVNGGGRYFSAKNPAELVESLTNALSNIESMAGSGSTNSVTSPDVSVSGTQGFKTSYKTAVWTGNLAAYAINSSTGNVGAINWCVESVGSCNGTLSGLVAEASDTRTIYKNNGSNQFESFVPANLDSTELALFDTTLLSQWSTLTTDQKANATPTNLVNFLRGQTGYEMQSSNADETKRVFRDREATLGDIVGSKPQYIAGPTYTYTDTDYPTFKSTNASRAGMVYVGGNDGMLHAFSASDGKEKWAFVPKAIMTGLWKLADKSYKTMHSYYVDGTPVIADVYDTSSDAWKTILVGGLNGGGRSFYAIDITTPTSPKLLWEIGNTTSGFAELGFSYGNPVVTKRSDGTWVVLLTSGYNNTSSGANTGKGILYVVNAMTGSKISQHVTAAGNSTTPSGLAKISTWVDYPGIDNTASYTYGGDLQGNLWRFDINTTNSSPVLLATLRDASGNAQSITTSPELGKIKGNKVVFVGTGKYLEVADIQDTSQNTIYAIKDTGSTLSNARSSLTELPTLTSACVADPDSEACNKTINWSSGNGWYIDLPASGYRINVDMKLASGYLAAQANLPTDEPCTTGGKRIDIIVDFKNGGLVYHELVNSLGTGIYVTYSGTKVSFHFGGQDGGESNSGGLDTGSMEGYSSTRVTWREWIPEEE